MIRELNTLLMKIVSLNKIIPEEYAWVALLFIVIFLTLIGNLFANWLLGRLGKVLEKTSTIWDDAVLGATKKPIGFFIWFGGAVWALHILAQHSGKDWSVGLSQFWRIGIIFILAWLALRLIGAVEQELSVDKEGRKVRDKTTLRAVTHILKLSTLITAALVMLQNLGISISGVLAFGGIGGIAVGFAARDLLANFFGAIMIFVDKPFKIGDWVRSPDREIEGTVEEIGWRMTRIRTFDLRPLYVPNSVFVNIAVENPSRMFARRILENFGLRYCDVSQMAGIVRDVKQMLIDHPNINHDQPLVVGFDTYGDFSLNFVVNTFTFAKTWAEYQEVKQDVLLKIEEIVHRHGADFAFPTQELLLNHQQQENSVDFHRAIEENNQPH